MARYRFLLLEDGRTDVGTDTIELPSLQGAKDEAARIVADWMRDDLIREGWHKADWQVNVHNESDLLLLCRSIITHSNDAAAISSSG